MLDFLVITIIALLVFQWIQSKPFFWQSAGIPYSIPLPIFGNTIGAFTESYHDVFVKLYKMAGNNPFYGFHLFGKPALVATDPATIKTIMINDSEYFMSHGFHSAPYDPMSKSVFFVDGEEWRTIRSKMTPSFTPVRLKCMLSFIKPLSEKFTNRTIEAGKKGSVDLADFSKRLFVDTVINTIFGLECDTLDNPESFFFKIQKEMIGFITGVKLMIGDLSPSLYAFFGFTLLARSTTSKLVNFVNETIKQRSAGIGTRPDFVQGMVELMEKEKTTKNLKMKNSDGTPVARFDNFTVAGQCMIMYTAGTETSANTLGFILYELALNPDIQEKTRKEINEMLNKNNGSFCYDDLIQLKYSHMVFYEAMRKYPSVATYSRKCTKAVTLNGVHIPVGTKIMLSPFAMHKDPKFYPDPEKFMPERFAEDSNIIPGSYIPYGNGPRTCLGIKFAEMGILSALCYFLPRARVLVSSKTAIPMTLSKGPTLAALNGVWLDIEEIK